MRRSFLAASALAASVLAAVPAWAAPEPLGPWDREDGKGGIRIARCGQALCGFVTWLRDKDSPAHLGQRVLYDLRPTAAGTWAGQALNPEDGQEYAGTLQLDGDRLVTKGCALGGMICKSVVLRRR